MDSPRLADHFRPTRTPAGILTPALAACDLWRSEQVGLADIAKWLSRTLGRTVRPLEASAVIVRVRDAAGVGFCRECGATLADKRRAVCSEACRERWFLRKANLIYHEKQRNPLNCAVCGSLLPRPSNRRFLCSDDCWRAWDNARRRDWYAENGSRALLRERTCQFCGKRFAPYNHRQRSCAQDGCRDETQRRLNAKYAAVRTKAAPQARPCAHCREEFTPAAHTATYCSPLCKSRAGNKRNQEWRARREAGEVLSKPCAVCGEPIVNPRGKQAYCGAECRRESDRQKDRERYRRAQKKLGIVPGRKPADG